MKAMSNIIIDQSTETKKTSSKLKFVPAKLPDTTGVLIVIFTQPIHFSEGVLKIA